MFDSFKETFENRWNALSRRDQKALLLLSISLVLAVVIFGLILPTANLQKKLKNDLASAQTTYQELLALAPQAIAASSGSRGNFNASNINSEVRRLAARHGVVIQRFEPDGELLKVWLEDVRYPNFVKWLGAVQSTGIAHLELSLEDRRDPGFISARVTFGVGN